METPLTPQAGRILQCAERLITCGGYSGFSYADISAEIGITKASIHHHFPRKADMVRELVRRHRTAAAKGLAAMTANIANPLDRLKAYASWWYTCIGDGSMPICVCAMLGAEITSIPAEIATEVRLHFSHLVSWLESAITAGEAGQFMQLQIPPSAEAQAFMATVHGAMLSARAADDPHLFEKIVSSTLERLAAPALTRS
jgi:TetR/AcrR family transcriptional repressor of nem operon